MADDRNPFFRKTPAKSETVSVGRSSRENNFTTRAKTMVVQTKLHFPILINISEPKIFQLKFN